MTINNSPVVVFSLSLPSFYLEWLCSDQNGKHGLVHAMLNWFLSYFFCSVSSLIFNIKIKQYTSQVGDWFLLLIEHIPILRNVQEILKSKNRPPPPPIS